MAVPGPRTGGVGEAPLAALCGGVPSAPRALQAAILLQSLAILLFELLLTRIFAVVLFNQYAHLALALALLGISAGAVVQHLRPSLLPDEGLERRLAWVGLGLGLAALLGVVATLYLPVLDLPGGLPESFQETSYSKTELLNPGVYALLLGILVLPFGFAGLAFAGTFQRRAQWIGRLYAVDLLGGAVGAALFIPLLATLAGPDVVFVILALACASAWVVGVGRVRQVAAGLGLVSLVLAGLGARSEVLPVRGTAGFSEQGVTYTLWTPLTRLAVYELPKLTLILLDNTSASEVATTARRRDELAEQVNRGLVYRVQPPGGRVAILAASAGPEVATAQKYGWTEIDAIDIAGEIFTIVRDRFPDAPTNPYRQPGVRFVKLDGRAAIAQSEERYAVIQMVHANLWSAAGMLANTWSPALLETADAFTTYFDHLAPGGVLSFGRGSQTDALTRSAVHALSERGVKEPWRNVAYVRGSGTVALMRLDPWTAEEVTHLEELLATYPKQSLAWDPTEDTPPRGYRELMKGEWMTDDRPYVDTWETVAGALRDVGKGKSDTPLAALYQSVVVQLGLAALAGLLLLGLPFLGRARAETRDAPGGGWFLPYCAALGYGYLAVETVLVHDLVLFVGHPTYAITAVVMTMLVSSGLGSMWVGTWSEAQVRGRLLAALGVVALLGALVGTTLAPWLVDHAFGLSPGLRFAITAVALAPLGFVMGLPFPAGVRLLTGRATAWVPWGWAMNGWMSVVGSLLTVLVARLDGYRAAFFVALGAYLLGLLVVALRRR